MDYEKFETHFDYTSASAIQTTEYLLVSSTLELLGATLNGRYFKECGTLTTTYTAPANIAEKMNVEFKTPHTGQQLADAMINLMFNGLLTMNFRHE